MLWEIKTELAFTYNLAGVMIWAIDADDFRGNCKAGKYPLLRKINNVLYKQVREEWKRNQTETNNGNLIYKKPTF